MTFGERYLRDHGEVAVCNRIVYLDQRAKEALWVDRDYQRHRNICDERNNLARAIGQKP